MPEVSLAGAVRVALFGTLWGAVGGVCACSVVTGARSAAHKVAQTAAAGRWAARAENREGKRASAGWNVDRITRAPGGRWAAVGNGQRPIGTGSTL